MIRIELTEEEWSRALNAIALAPYVQVAQLIEKMARQIQEQKQESGNGKMATNSHSLPERTGDGVGT